MEVLREGGLVAAFFFLVLIAFAATVRVLWNVNQSLNRQLREMQEQHRKEMVALQDKRVEDAQEATADEREITKEVIAHVETTKTSVDQIRSAVQTLTDVIVGRR